MGPFVSVLQSLITAKTTNVRKMQHVGTGASLSRAGATHPGGLETNVTKVYRKR